MGEIVSTMPWRVQYRDGDQHLISRYPTPELAIAGACGLIDSGFHVFAIGTGELSDSIGTAEIAKIYDLWDRARPG